MMDLKGKIDAGGMIEALKKEVENAGCDGFAVNANGLFEVRIHPEGLSITAAHKGLCETVQSILCEALGSGILSMTVASSFGLRAIEDKWASEAPGLQKALNTEIGEPGGLAACIVHKNEIIGYVSNSKGEKISASGLINEAGMVEFVVGALEK